MRTDEKTTAAVRIRVSTALGDFAIEASARGLRAVTPLASEAGTQVPAAHPGGVPTPDAAVALRRAQAAADALRRYASGEHARDEGPLDVAASPLHLAVWERLRAIPFGGTTHYGAIAAAVGMPGEARAVGAAVAANPVCILVPCHRVVGADGSLKGFAWGLDLKRRLLAHEGSLTPELFPEAVRA